MAVAANITSQQLIARAAALVPMLREKAASAERAQRVAPETFDALSEAGVFRMTAPARYGGYVLGRNDFERHVLARRRVPG